jgi:hypothetical protein
LASLTLPNCGFYYYGGIRIGIGLKGILGPVRRPERCRVRETEWRCRGRTTEWCRVRETEWRCRGRTTEWCRIESAIRIRIIATRRDQFCVILFLGHAQSRFTAAIGASGFGLGTIEVARDRRHGKPPNVYFWDIKILLKTTTARFVGPLAYVTHPQPNRAGRVSGPTIRRLGKLLSGPTVRRL